MQTEQSGDTNSKIAGAQINKKKHRPKKVKPASINNNKENSSTVNAENAINSSVKKKKKRNNNNKKNIASTGEKTENLISKTFKASKIHNTQDERFSNGVKPERAENNSCTKSNSQESKQEVSQLSTTSNPLLDAILNPQRPEQKSIGKNVKGDSSKNSHTRECSSETTHTNLIKNNKGKNTLSKNSQPRYDSNSPPELINKPKRQIKAKTVSPESDLSKNNQKKGKIDKSFNSESVQIISSNQRAKQLDNTKESNVTPLEPINTLELTSKDNVPKTCPEMIQKEKNREEILAAREAKKLAKQQGKKGIKNAANSTVTMKDSPVNAIKETNTAIKEIITNTDTNVNDTKNVLTNKVEKVENNLESVKPPQESIPSSGNQKIEKTREEILAEREAKKLAKQAAKNKSKVKIGDGEESKITDSTATKLMQKKAPVGTETKDTDFDKTKNVDDLANKLESIHMTAPEVQKKKPTTKAERRAIQEAQREAKAKLLAEKQQNQKTNLVTKQSTQKKDIETKPPSECRKIEKVTTITSPSKLRTFKVKLFNHLDWKTEEQNSFVNNQQIHPEMVRLGEQYAKRTVVGSNARCIAFLNALKMVIQDYETPPKKEFSRGLEAAIKNCVDHLQKCRPLAVSVTNAYKYMKVVLTKLPTNQSESDLKKYLVELIDIYIKDQIEKASQAISYYLQEKISDGDVILTYGCSSLITHILEEAHLRHVDFRVIVVDSRPFNEGQELLRRLVSKGISCTCVLINAVSFIMSEVTTVLLGAHALLANGYVMSRTGAAQVALVARSFNVPVLVCCETHKFSERVQTDAIVYNELGNPNDLISKTKDCRLSNWKSYPSLYPLNLNYDVTPPELVTAVVTEVRFLPWTSVPVILRVRPTEMLS